MSTCVKKLHIVHLSFGSFDKKIVFDYIYSIPNPVGNIYTVLCLEDYSTEPTDVPQNHKRAICDLTAADRLALYDHVIQEAIQQSAKASNNDDLYVDLVSKLNRGECTTPCR